METFCFNWLCLTPLQQGKRGVPPHYCQAEVKTQILPSSSVDIWRQKWGEGSSLLSGTVQFPDPHVVSTDTVVGGGGLVPIGQWFGVTPILAGKEKKRYLITGYGWKTRFPHGLH